MPIGFDGMSMSFNPVFVLLYFLSQNMCNFIKTSYFLQNGFPVDISDKYLGLNNFLLTEATVDPILLLNCNIAIVGDMFQIYFLSYFGVANGHIN